jgi:hypothetical protein
MEALPLDSKISIAFSIFESHHKRKALLSKTNGSEGSLAPKRHSQ